MIPLSSNRESIDHSLIVVTVLVALAVFRAAPGNGILENSKDSKFCSHSMRWVIY